MSQVFREAIDHLRAALVKIDARAEELHTELDALQRGRAQLVALIDGDAAPVTPSAAAARPATALTHESSGGPTHAVTSPRPAAAPAPPPATPPNTLMAATRILAALKDGPQDSATVFAAAQMASQARAKRLVRDLVATGRIALHGRARGSRYSLPVGRRSRSAAAPADSEGD